MINPSGGINSVGSNLNMEALQANKPSVSGDGGGFSDAVDALGKYVSDVSDAKRTANMSITDLLAGKTEDINTVVAAVAKSDMSFKLLVGVRNKLVEAYKRTMQMPI